MYNNSSCVDPDNPETKYQLVLYDVLIPIIGFLIIFLNLVTVLSSGLIVKNNVKPKCTYLFLGNVALTDLVTGVAIVFGQFYPVDKRNHTICCIEIGLIVASTLASIYSVGLIAIDRFLYIIYGVKYKLWLYVKRAHLLIVCTWFIGLVMAFMPLYGWSGNTKNGEFCWFMFAYPKYLILLIVIIAILPITVIVVLYSIILYSALKSINFKDNIHLRKFRGNNASVAQQTISITPITTINNNRSTSNKIQLTKIKMKSRCRAIKIVLLTTLTAVITWYPFFIASLIYVNICDNVISKRCNSLRVVIASPLSILGFTNSLINPIIYAWWHTGFRTFITKRVSTIISRSRTINSSSSQKDLAKN